MARIRGNARSPRHPGSRGFSRVPPKLGRSAGSPVVEPRPRAGPDPTLAAAKAAAVSARLAPSAEAPASTAEIPPGDGFRSAPPAGSDADAGPGSTGGLMPATP